MLILRILAFTAGLALVVAFFVSAMRVTLLLRRRHDRLASVAARATRRAFDLLVHLVPADRRSGLQDYLGPMALLALLITWFAAVLLGYTLMYWAVGEPSLAESLVFSGSSLTTTGFATPTSYAGRLLAITEGAIGLGVVAILITYLPSLQSAVQQRDVMASWVAARAGAPVSGPAFLAWYYARKQGDVDEVWSTGEQWFRSLGQSQAAQPLLIAYRPLAPARSWVAAAGALLDAAALALTALALPDTGPPEVLLEAGVRALEELAGSVARSLVPAQIEDVSPATYAAALDRLRASGAPVRSEAEATYDAFAALRARYLPSVQRLAAATETLAQVWE